ncbi:MAG: tetratricopeptide repeat protein [Phycisphaerae bacterium]|nr:tetratricopeptide repeat protein [Phycisphaerae bacterium]
MSPAGKSTDPASAQPARIFRPGTAMQVSVPKKLAFAAVTIVALFAAAEAMLAVLGVRPVLFDEDPYVGFSSNIPLFVEQAGPDGKPTMVTAKNKLPLFNLQRFARNKPVGTYRIFCVGGSTTFGRPYDDMTSFCGWLRAMLPEADPSRKWELINAGGVSYASYRVAALMAELVRYEPDLFVIYSGHNEFLERRTYGRIINTPAAVRGLGAVMSRTRTYGLLQRAIKAATGRSGKAGQKRDYLPGEVKTILENSLGPQEYHRDGESRRRVFDHYRYNLSRMVDIARSVGAEVILVRPASNLRHCWPFKSEHSDGLDDAERKNFQALYDQASKAHATGQWNESLAAIDRAITADDRYAHAHYLRGRVLWELERYDQAKAAFERAIDEDVCPLRAQKPILDIVVEVAGGRDVPVVDFVEMVERQSEHGTPGEKLFLDHVHPTIEGNRQLALALLETMSRRRMVQLAGTWGDAEIERIRQEVESSLDLTAHGAALRNISRLFRWAGKYEEGYKLGVLATEMVPTDAEAFFQVAGNAMELGRIDEAISYYRQALQIEPNYARAHCGLAIALQSQGHTQRGSAGPDEATGHYLRALQLKPDYPEAHTGLGRTLAARYRLDEAISHYRQALRIEPDLVYAHCGLGIVLHLQGKLDEAVSHYRRALRIDPEHAEAHSSLACALAEQGKLDEAIDHYRRTLKIKPGYAEVHYRLGRTLIMAGQFNGALEHFRRAAQLKPDWPDPLNGIAQILVIHPDGRVRNASEAVNLAERAATLTEYKDASVLDTLAAAYAGVGRFDRAVATAHTAIGLASAAGAAELVEYLRKQLEIYENLEFKIEN